MRLKVLQIAVPSLLQLILHKLIRLQIMFKICSATKFNSIGNYGTVEPLLSDFFYPNFQLSDLKPTLPTQFRPVILDPSIIQPFFYPNQLLLPQDGRIIEVVLYFIFSDKVLECVYLQHCELTVLYQAK